MYQCKIVVEKITASLDLVEPGITFINMIEITHQLNLVKTTVERIVHALQLYGAVNIIISESIAKIKQDIDVFTRNVFFKVIERWMQSSAAKLERLIQGNSCRKHPGSFLFPIVKSLAKYQQLLPCNLVIDFVNRIKKGGSMGNYINTILVLNIFYYFVGKGFNTDRFPETTVFFICRLCGAAHLYSKISFRKFFIKLIVCK